MDKIRTFKDFKNYAQLLAAHHILHDYLDLELVLSEIRDSTNCEFSKIEPESYGEGWLKNNIVGVDKEWKDNAFSYFIDLLVNYKYEDLKNE